MQTRNISGCTLFGNVLLEGRELWATADCPVNCSRLHDELHRQLQLLSDLLAQPYLAQSYLVVPAVLSVLCLPLLRL